MDSEYWKSSPFGENSIFHPSWEEKEKERRRQKEYLANHSFNKNVRLIFVNHPSTNYEPTNGYYYLKDGTFLGQFGKSNLITICSKTEIKNGELLFYILFKTNIQYDELIAVAGTAIGESSFGYQVENKDEVYALANAIMNFYRIKTLSKGSVKDSISKMKAYAYTKQNEIYKKFINTGDFQRNDSFFKEAICAALNAMCTDICIDYSNGATHWDGIDIKANGKWAEGLKFQNNAADIFKIGDNKKHTEMLYRDQTCYEKIFDYRWLALCGYYGINDKKENPYYPYYNGDTINKHKFGTVFMRESDEFNNRIPYGKIKKNH